MYVQVLLDRGKPIQTLIAWGVGLSPHFWGRIRNTLSNLGNLDPVLSQFHNRTGGGGMEGGHGGVQVLRAGDKKRSLRSKPRGSSVFLLMLRYVLDLLSPLSMFGVKTMLNVLIRVLGRVTSLFLVKMLMSVDPNSDKIDSHHYKVLLENCCEHFLILFQP